MSSSASKKRTWSPPQKNEKTFFYGNLVTFLGNRVTLSGNQVRHQETWSHFQETRSNFRKLGRLLEFLITSYYKANYIFLDIGETYTQTSYMHTALCIVERALTRKSDYFKLNFQSISKFKIYFERIKTFFHFKPFFSL